MVAGLQIRDILDSLDEGILTVDAEGRILDINRAGCEILEITKAEAMSLGCPRLFGPALCAEGSPLRQAVAERRAMAKYEIRVPMRSGKTKVLTLRTTIFRGSAEGPPRGILIFDDVSELRRLREDLGQRFRLHNLIGKSKAMRLVFELIEQVADTDATVLIQGETGTGKELVARAIHHLGPRSAKPFLAVNCSALPESLLESELFGHRRGAFTGALRDKQGRFELASGGTILLDEIGDIPPGIQAKLLRVLQEREVDPLGADAPVAVDLRVLAATNRPLEEMLASGAFREDLYYRLSVVPIHIAPLRERPDDLPVLAMHFIEKFRYEMKHPIKGISPEAMAILQDHSWPGNVRELQNAIEHAFVRVRSGLIKPEHLPARLRDGAAAPAGGGPSDSEALRHGGADRGRTERALAQAGWNISKAARRLGISRTTLYKRIERYGLREGAG